MARPRAAAKYATRFPQPLYWHRNSFLTYGDEPQDAGAAAGAAEGASRGLSTVAGNAYGFLSPKISMGRGIAAGAIKSALSELKVSKPFVVTGKGGAARLGGLFQASGVVAEPAAMYAVGGEPTVEVRLFRGPPKGPPSPNSQLEVTSLLHPPPPPPPPCRRIEQDARRATEMALAAGCDGVLCVGGGSALDLGKVGVAGGAVWIAHIDPISPLPVRRPGQGACCGWAWVDICMGEGRPPHAQPSRLSATAPPRHHPH